MPGRDDFGSRAGTPGGMGGSLGNGGVGGGMGGGMRGGGAGYNGGIGSRMGVTTGTRTMPSAFGRPGGMAQGYGMNPAQARQAAMQGILGRLQGRAQPTGAPPPQGVNPAMPGLHPSMWMNNPTQRPYDPATSPASYNPLASMRPRAPTMQDYPQFQNSPMPGGPGNIKNTSRLPGDHPFVSGQNWGNPGAGSMGLGSSGGGRAGGNGGGW